METKSGIIKHYILREIKAGRIKRGQRLPSCRAISSLLSINKLTVNKAFKELEGEHKIYSIPRGGFYLIDFQEKPIVATKEVDFRTVKLEDKLIPYREFTHVMNKAIDTYKHSLFSYESDYEASPLIETLKEEFEKDGIYTTHQNIIVTHGAQQAIGLVLQTIFKNNKGKLLVEDPTYDLLLKLADHLKIEITAIKRHKEGFDYKKMELIFKSGQISAFYIMPRHHNPTGYTLTEQGKQKVAALAYKYNVLIIEDDYLADLGSRKGSLPIHYYDQSKYTVYIRSFSKAFMPGIRLGAAVIPKSIVEEVMSLKYLSDLNTSKLPQAALELFIRSGMYQKHIKKVKNSYERKLKKAAEIFKALSPEGLQWHVPDHGIFIWLKLPEHIDSQALEKKLEQQKILIKAADDSFIKKEDQKQSNHIRLCISGVSEEQIDDIATLISVINSSF